MKNKSKQTETAKPVNNAPADVSTKTGSRGAWLLSVHVDRLGVEIIEQNAEEPDRVAAILEFKKRLGVKDGDDLPHEPVVRVVGRK